MKAEQLRKSILQLAIQGKLVPQDPADEPASVLLERIRAEKQRLIKEGKIKKDKGDSVIFKGDDNCYYEKTGSEVKNITDEIPFDIPDSWCWVRLSNFGNISAGGTPDRGNPNYWGGSIPWLKISDITSSKKFVSTCTEFITDEGMNNSSAKLLPTGTILYTIFATIGEVGILTFNATCNQAIAGIQTYLNSIDEYLYYYLVNLQDFMKSLSKGCAQFNINQKILKSALVPFPPLTEQKRIVAEIEKFEPLIAEYDRLEQQATKLDGEIYDKLEKSILQYAIQGKLVPQDSNDEPASVLLERIRAEKKAQLGKKYVESYIYKGDDNCYYEKVGKNEPVLLENLPFDIPDSWCWARFIDIVSFENGDRSNKYPVEEDYVPFGIPFWGAKDIINKKLTPTNNLRYISQAKFDELGNGKLQNNDFVCLLRGAVGKWASFETNKTITTGFINAQMVIIRPKFKSFIKWLKVYFSSPLFSQLCENFTSGTAVAQMSAKDLSKFYVPIPPYNEQIRICNQIETMLSKLKDEK